MGSLMSGWSSPFQDPKKVKYMRNKSMTRAEIDSYWKSKKKTEEDDVAYSPSLPTTPTAKPHNHESASAEKVFRRSASMPMEQTSSEELQAPDHDQFITQDHLDVFFKKSSCWWMASNSAFLNEPPVLVHGPTQNRRLCEAHAGSTSSAKPDIGIAI